MDDRRKYFFITLIAWWKWIKRFIPGCTIEDGAIVIKPPHRGTTEFSVEILKDLVDQGYSGDELIRQFEIQSNNIKTAVTNMLEEADAIVAGEKPAADLDDISVRIISYV